MVAKKNGRSSKRSNNTAQRQRQKAKKNQVVNVVNNNNEAPVPTTAEVEKKVESAAAEVIKKLMSGDATLQKELDQLLELVDGEPKKLDPKKLRSKMPKLTKHILSKTLEPDALGECIGQRYLLSTCTGTTLSNEDEDSEDKVSNKRLLLANKVGQGLARIIVGQHEHDEDNDSEDDEEEESIQARVALANVLDSIQADVSQALLEYVDLTGYAMEEAMSNEFCGTLIDLECRKWADTLDRLIFYDEAGAFLGQCPVYQQPTREIQRVMENLMEKSKKSLQEDLDKSKQIHFTVATAAMSISHDIDQVNRDCWECGKVCKSKLSACSLCKTANYCSAACQRKAWSCGHKHKCKALASNYCLYQDSLDIMDATHAGDEFQQLTVVEEKVDYRIFCHVFTSPAEGFKKGTMKGPSMKYFYQNMERIQNDGWWMISVGFASLAEYNEAVTAWGDQALSEELNFLNLAHCLCFDLIGYYAPKMQMERIGNPALAKFSDNQLVAMAITSDLGFGKRHPREIGMPMPATRFLQLYKYLGGAYDVGKLWANTKRQLKKQVLKDFRDIHHK